MRTMRHVTTGLITLVRARRVAAIALLGCLLLALTPLGCTNSIEMAPARYREQHPNARHLLRDITVERLQECFEKYGHQLASESSRVEATVRVDQEGRSLSLLVEGIPDSAPDFAACTRTTLRDMAVPESLLRLRPEQTASTTNGRTMPMGNEMANPVVAWELAAVLAEFIAQHGGRVVVYSVALTVLTPLAVLAVGKLSKRCRQVKEACIISCGDSKLPTGDYAGNPFHKCLRECMERAGCF